jgi:hypothetical protein
VNERYQYCFIRKDLSEVQRIVQMAHATMEMGKRMPQQDTEPCNLILFEVPDERSLVTISRYLTEAGVEHYMFDEPDYDTGYTAIACVPVEGAAREYFVEFDLYRGSNEDLETIRRRTFVEV